MLDYVVYLITYSGDKMPKYYIGSTSLEKILEGYMGTITSKKYKDIYYQEIKDNIELFYLEILSYHNSRKEALEKEYKLQKEWDVVKNENFINQSIAAINGFFGRDVKGINNPNYGNYWNETQRNHMSKIMSSEYKQREKEQTSLERYGVKNPMQNEEIHNKFVNTYEKLSGFENPFSNPKIQEEVKRTKLEKYGDENYNNLEKMKQTKLEKYGDENYNNLEKMKKTNLEKYNTEYSINTIEVQEETKQTNLEKYGVENPFQSKEVQEKIKQTNLEKYGVENPAQCPSIKQKQIETKKENDKKLDRNRVGWNNSNAKLIYIFDNKGNIRYKCYGDFYKTCKNNKLPLVPLRESFQNNGIPIFQKKHSKKHVKRLGKEKYIGWYAKIIQEDQKC